MFCGASQLWALIYFEFLATLITENALVKSRDMLSGWMCFTEFQLGESGYLHGNHSRPHKLKIHNGCKYCHESGIRTRAQIGRRLRLREDRLGPGYEVGQGVRVV